MHTWSNRVSENFINMDKNDRIGIDCEITMKEVGPTTEMIGINHKIIMKEIKSYSRDKMPDYYESDYSNENYRS